MRTGRRLTLRALARRAGISAPYLLRIEQGTRPVPERAVVERLVLALELGDVEADQLFTAANMAPLAVARLGPGDRDLAAVARVLARADADAAARFRDVLRLLVRQWEGPG